MSKPDVTPNQDGTCTVHPNVFGSVSGRQLCLACNDVSVKRIVARNIGLWSVAPCIKKYKDLETLDVSRNVHHWGNVFDGAGTMPIKSESSQFSHVDRFQRSLKNLGSLKKLKNVSVRGNGITSLKPLLDAIYDAESSIEVLDAGENQLGMDSKRGGIALLETIKGSLKELYLDRNRLSSIQTRYHDGFDNDFPKLEILDLSGNNLEQFPGSMSPYFDPDVIKKIDLSGNCKMYDVGSNTLRAENIGRVGKKINFVVDKSGCSPSDVFG